MTKLEEKLYELGYTYFYHSGCFKKKFSRFIFISIELNNDKTEVDDFGVDYKTDLIRKQYQIDTLQLAFNEMQKDLEILKECEEYEN